MRVGLILAALAVTGCATTPKRASLEEFSLWLPPAALGRPLSLVQRLTVVRGAETRAFDALLEIDDQALNMGIVALGQTLGTLSWDGKSLGANASTVLPGAITPPRILTDVQLVWWPLEAVQREAPPSYQVAQQGPVRTVTRGGQPFATVTYEGEGPVWKRVVLEHHGRYRLVIESTEHQP